ncbi:hypothetical protein [Daejeonella sp. JGW-45]|uniref:hypothetical protein n=1 Tax=Daejeonella sp. JGW-45 TaxID=3034148 RepID=UPI0023EDE052|nr:hypothetical protein [Daejeonella sp. JGW-45]
MAEEEETINPDETASLDDFKKAYGENFSDTIDIDTWRVGENLAELYPLIESEILSSKKDELKHHKTLRDDIFVRIKEKARVPHAGLHSDIDIDIIQKIHRGFLFNGAVTACGSVSAVYNSVPISITQIGVCLVTYQGQHGSYSHRLFRRDLRYKSDDPIKEALNLIEKRQSSSDKSGMSTLAIRGIKTYAECAILLDKSESNWLLGAGSPTPYEMMTGFWASRPEMKDKSIALMQKMILSHQRFVYVQNSSRNQLLWTFGNALNPYEFLVIDTMEDNLTQMVELGGTRGEFRQSYEKFAKEVGAKIAYGVYRVSQYSQPQIFYCHVDHVQTAALIAMADGALQLHKGSPMLLDLADNLCQTAFGKNDFVASIDQAHAKADVNLRGNNNI